MQKVAVNHGLIGIKMADFLLEIYGEEIPPQSQIEGKRYIKDAFNIFLNENKIKYELLETFTTSRRFVIYICGLPQKKSGDLKKIRGPSTLADKKALEGFLNSNQIKSKEKLIKEKLNGKEYYFFLKRIPSEKMEKIFSNFIPEALKNFKWKKSMRWSNHREKWIRPINKILCLFDEKIIKFEFAGIISSRHTIGNYLYSKEEKECFSFKEYKNFLKKNKVVLEQNTRKNKITFALEDICKKYKLTKNFDEKLIDENSNLVEYPNIFLGEFDKVFFSMPKKFLETVISGQQKYFSFHDKDRNLSNFFAFISNQDKDKKKVITSGNERVLKARFKDALFFIKEDLSIKLKDRLKMLREITYYENLGNLEDKTHRLLKITKFIGELIDFNLSSKQEEIIRISKADLTTEMVKEFPSLQGSVGSYYAKMEGYLEKDFIAITDQYLPLFQKDNCPKTIFSSCLAIAEKIDNILASFLSGKKPSGSKDPFGLRRAALGIIRILVEKQINLNLSEVLLFSFKLFNYDKCQNNFDIEEVIDFVFKRFESYMKDKGIQIDYINAVNLNKTKLKPLELFVKSKTVIEFRAKNEGIDFLASYNRVESILLASSDKVIKLDVNLFKCIEEKFLYEKISIFQNKIKKNESIDLFSNSLNYLLDLTEPINNFFDNVKVNSDKEITKKNRISLLMVLKKSIDEICDFSELE